MATRRIRMPLPDRETVTRLARAAQQNDERALDELLSALRPAFVGFFARRMTHDAAEDLTQAALIRAVQLLGHMRAERVTQHMRTIARALLRDEHVRLERERERHAPVGLGERVEWPVDLERRAEYEELVGAVHRATRLALPSELQTIVLQLLGGRTPAEIATELGIDLPTVRLLLLRARVILRRELRSYVDRC
jgi:RNA polymerase sigma factor (sigma-70 family)